MNKKGFTLVEILVSIGLLALLGSVIAISLNRVFKDNNIKNYNEYVEKVKSSAMLYVNNTVDIINDLNDSSFKIITIGDLVDNGYLNDNLVNPNTNEKVGKNEEIKVSYDSDHELIVEYPYNNSEIEAYLYTLNYSVMYGDTTDNLCYVGLNTRSLQLINLDGQKVKDLTLNQTIRAYMENGEECTNLTSEKIGTYKIRYDYTKEDNKTLDDSDVNKRSAERTITVKPSKPIINKFEVTKDKNAVSKDKNAIYNPTITYNVTDSSKKTDMKLKYCINTTGKINDCSSWSEAKNSQDISLKINLNDLDKNISGKNKVDIYLFVKNGFEEYTYKSQNYKISLTVKIELNGGKYNNSTNDLTFNNVDYNKKISDIVKWSSFKKAPINKFKFEGLKDSNENEYKANSVITEDLTLTAQWYEYCSYGNKTLKSTSCSETCGGGKIINHYVDSNYQNHNCGDETTSETCNTQKCYVECSSTTTSYDCKKYDSSDTYCKKQYYEIDNRTGTECDRWWSEDRCSCSEGGSSGGSGSSETKCQCVTSAVPSGACYCGSSGDPGTSGVIEHHWKSSTGESLCCCIPAGCKW